MSRPVNLGGMYINLLVYGADDALRKLDELAQKVKEVNELIEALKQQKVEIRPELVSGNDQCQ